MDEFKIKVGEFEGPLELLLDLIEKRKLHINDVSLSQVTDDFINYLKALQEFSIPGISHFVLVASTLLLIKSRSLLPALSHLGVTRIEELPEYMEVRRELEERREAAKAAGEKSEEA